MPRFILEVYFASILIFFKEFKSITSVAKCIDCFSVSKDYEFKFVIYDYVHGLTIDSSELMRIWHSKGV